MYDLKVLYVEDNVDIMESLSAYLKDICKDVYLAKDGIEALKIFKTNSIDVVITDILMPNMNGLELSKKILSIDNDIPIIITTAHNENDYLYEAINLGIQNYLLKPIDLKKLDSILDKIFQQKEKDRKIENYQRKLAEINTQLEEKVKSEIAKNKQKDIQLFSQSKHAQMGEMLNMIAHQWRQPLNVISASCVSMNLKLQLNKLKEEDILEHTKVVGHQTQNMSKTIDNFMNFFKPESNKSEFCLKELIEEMNYIVNAQLKHNDIEMELTGENIKIYSYKNELIQVLLNLVSNAKDAFEDKDISDKKITISVEEQNKQIEIKVQDNAGGIEDKYIDRIFDAYFTTKEQGKGTGIGLYMSKRIVEEVLNGDISVSNTNAGAEFKITLTV